MDRRAFLDPRHLTQSAGHLLGASEALSDALAQTDAPLDCPLIHLGWRAMATQWEIVLPLDCPQATAAGRDSFEHLDQIESRLTVYRPHSEVSRLNDTAAHAPVQVAEDLFGLLVQAKQLHEDTQGAFDIAIGALIKSWGFFKGPRRVPSEAVRLSALHRSGMKRVQLDANRQAVSFEVQGLELNLGALGKGWALDQLVARLQDRWKIQSGLLHGGRSSVYGMGCPAYDPRGWCVGISHPDNPARRLARAWLRNRALGTSAATFQFLEHEGRKLGHVLDPRNGWPAEGIASCSVVAATSAEADALSTAFFVLGIDAARTYCERNPTVGMLLLPEGTDSPTILGSFPGVEE